MELKTETVNGALVATVAAERIDAACAVQFKDQVRAIMDGAPDLIVLNMGEVDFVDSSGLGAIVAAMKLADANQKMVLTSLTPTVQRLFSLTRLDSVFAIFAAPADAINDLKKAG